MHTNSVLQQCFVYNVLLQSLATSLVYSTKSWPSIFDPTNVILTVAPQCGRVVVEEAASPPEKARKGNPSRK